MRFLFVFWFVFSIPAASGHQIIVEIASACAFTWAFKTLVVVKVVVFGIILIIAVIIIGLGGD